VAPRLNYLKLHIIMFEFSWIMLIVSCKGLSNPLLTNHLVTLWKNVLELTSFNLCVLWRNPWHVQNHPIVVFHIFLGNVYNLFERCKSFFVYFRICPSPCRPFICFVNCLFPLCSPCSSRISRVPFLGYSNGFLIISHIYI